MVAGFRCSTSEFSYVILNGSRSHPEIIRHGVRKKPRAYSHHEFLKWARERIHEILSEFEIGALGYKRAETNRRPEEERVHLEGILIEYACSAGIQNITNKLKSQIRKDLGFQREARYVSQIISSGPLSQDLNSSNLQEAALIALCLLD